MYISIHNRYCNWFNQIKITVVLWSKFVYIRTESRMIAEMCSERDSPLKRLYRRTHAKLTRLAGSGQLVWAADCELSLALVHAQRPAWPGETSETILRVAPPRKTWPPDHTRVNWPVDASASGSAQVGPGGRHRWAARVQVGQEPARQKAREGYPSHYTSLMIGMHGIWYLVQYMISMNPKPRINRTKHIRLEQNTNLLLLPLICIPTGWSIVAHAINSRTQW